MKWCKIFERATTNESIWLLEEGKDEMMMHKPVRNDASPTEETKSLDSDAGSPLKEDRKSAEKGEVEVVKGKR